MNKIILWKPCAFLFLYIFVHKYIYIYIYSWISLYKDESKVWQHIGNVRLTLSTGDAFAMVIKVANHTRLLDANLAWYSLSVTCDIGPYAQPQNPWFLANLTLSDSHGSCKPSELSRINWLLYCDKLLLHFSHQTFLVVFVVVWPISNSWSITSQIRLHCIFFCMAFKSHIVNQCTTCQHTNYHNTTNHCQYLSWHELIWSCDICFTNWHVLKQCKTFD